MIPLTLLAVHFIGDFLLQSNWMATNKSKGGWPLLTHVGTYALCFLPWGWRFMIVTFLFHFVTDAATSQLTGKLWFVRGITWRRGEMIVDYDMRKRHWFFVMIGFDQLLHYAALAFTWRMLI